MKRWSVVVLILLAGCVSSPTLEQLETQALLTGDWTAVEKRERVVARRQMYSSMQCPAGYIGYCEESIVSRECSCVQREGVRLLLYGH
jgi:hypothetical protein